MKRNHLVTMAVAAGALVMGMLLAGGSGRSLLLPLLVLACPLMMVFMMRGHGGGYSGSDQHPERENETTRAPE